MLAGRRPFAGATNWELVNAIVNSPAPALSEEIPAALRGLAEKALEKDPANRYQSMREMVVDLRRLLRQSEEVSAHVPAPSRGRRLSWAGGLAGLVLIGLVALLYSRWPKPAAPRPAEYTQITNFTDLAAESPALSPDGRMLTFIRGERLTLGGRGEIYIKLLPDGEPVQLTRDGAPKLKPVFSPRGDRVAYGVTGPMTGPDKWMTWTVSVFGGEPRLMLANSSALAWIPNTNPPQVLFSQWNVPPHMSIVAAAENRTGLRTIYSPASASAMAHFSFLSPDGKNVLVVEMEGGWRPCRVVPFEGGGTGKLVGPPLGQCSTAAWSPDGKWMYFSINTGSGYHIWRQEFPDGTPEQVTFGATEEEGIEFEPGGKSFLTSAGTRQSTLWVHDARGDRQITSEGYATLPRFSSDGKQLYFLLQTRARQRYVSGELWVASPETGQRRRLLPDFLLEHYSISSDGRRIVFAAIDNAGVPRPWIATLNGNSPPRQLAGMRAERIFFGAEGEVLFLGRHSNPSKTIINRVREDGNGLTTATSAPVSYLYDVSPEGKAFAVWAGGPVVVHFTDGSPAVVASVVCAAAGGANRGTLPPCVSWSPDGKFLYLNDRERGQIFAVPLQPGRGLPKLPAGGIASAEQAAALPGARVIREPFAYPGSNPAVYAFFRVTSQGNIYRVPVP